MIRLKTAIIENFRGIEHLELPLHLDLTVLVGVNGAGKTSVLDALAVALSRILHYFPSASGVDFKKSDFRRQAFQRTTFQDMEINVPLKWFYNWAEEDIAPFTRVQVEAENGMRWHASKARDRKALSAHKIPPGGNDLRIYANSVADMALAGDHDVTVPVVAAYRNSRAVIETPKTRRGFKAEFSRFHGLDGALTATANFRRVVEWLFAEEDLERRAREKERNWDIESPLLRVVRRAVEQLIPGCKNLRVEVRPLRVEVDRDLEGNNGRFETLSLDQMSDGFRTMFALVIDLAHRMATTNPFMENPLEAPAVVLIDEVDLHLHPRWQQSVLSDLRRVFKNTQFIVSTHSPQVLTMVEQSHIIVLDRDERGRIVRRDPEMDPYGAESGRVLEAIFGVEQRPPSEINDFVKDLSDYWDFVKSNRFDDPQARVLFDRLRTRSPADPSLVRLDLEVRRRRAVIARGQVP